MLIVRPWAAMATTPPDSPNSPCCRPSPCTLAVAKGFADACNFDIFYGDTCPPSTLAAPRDGSQVAALCGAR